MRAVVRATVLACAVLVVTVLAAGCTEDPTTRPDRGQDVTTARAADPMMVERLGQELASFEPHASPAAMLVTADVAVWGVVETVEDGRVFDAGGGPQTHHVVIGVRPVEVVKDAPDRPGELLYVELARSENGPDADIDALRAGMRGARVAVVGYRYDTSLEVIRADAGREPGTPVFHPFPQGLWLETETGLASVLSTAEVEDRPWSAITTWEDLERLLRAVQR